MEDKIKSVLQLNRLVFDEMKFERDPLSPISDDYEINFNREVEAADDKEHFNVKLTLNLWSKKANSLRIKISLIGAFFCNSEDDTLKEYLIKYNTIAILFPYIRSQVSLITAQPDFKPIVLPPVNIVAMFESVDNQKESENKDE